jgi:2-polyprenyl-3-methyl-5-hydroxy-6-metoxy-1,4-benzoquinol methylase
MNPIMETENKAICPVCGSTKYRIRKTCNGLKMGYCADCTIAYAIPLIKGTGKDVGNANSSITQGEYYDMILKQYETQSELAFTKVPLVMKSWSKLMDRIPESVLEIGCGTGQYYQAWRKAGINWKGAEVNQTMLDFCRSKKMPVEEFDRILRRGEKYDVIYMSQVLEHILEPLDFLKKIGSLLNKGGILHLDVPNQESVTSLYRRMNPFHKEYGFVQPMHHLIAYTRKSLQLLLTRCNYDVIYLKAHTEEHPVFGQLLVEKTLLHQLAFKLSDITGKGSLLVCIAKGPV